MKIHPELRDKVVLSRFFDFMHTWMHETLEWLYSSFDPTGRWDTNRSDIWWFDEPDEGTRVVTMSSVWMHHIPLPDRVTAVYGETKIIDAFSPANAKTAGIASWNLLDAAVMSNELQDVQRQFLLVIVNELATELGDEHRAEKAKVLEGALKHDDELQTVNTASKMRSEVKKISPTKPDIQAIADDTEDKPNGTSSGSAPPPPDGPPAKRLAFELQTVEDSDDHDESRDSALITAPGCFDSAKACAPVRAAARRGPVRQRQSLLPIQYCPVAEQQFPPRAPCTGQNPPKRSCRSSFKLDPADL